ncbi:MAG: creatininase, partial [Rhizobiales bacterium 32-66-8]
MQKRFWADVSAPELAGLDRAALIAVLPVAAIEQHGPHLPLGTDAHIAEGYIARILPLLPDTLPVLFLPVQTIGVSDEHLSFTGTLTLAPETALAAW